MKNKINEANKYECVLCETGETDKHGLMCSCNKPKGTIKILVEGGIVQDVTGLPEGYDYEVDDKDI
jgi:hypothetical protein